MIMKLELDILGMEKVDNVNDKKNGIDASSFSLVVGGGDGGGRTEGGTRSGFAITITAVTVSSSYLHSEWSSI